MKDKQCKTKGCKNLISSKMSKSGLCSRCLSKKYKEENKEELLKYGRDYNKKYYQDNKESLSEFYKKYRNENKEKIAKLKSDYYKRKTKHCKDKSKEHYEKNKEKRLEQTRINQNKRYREDEGFRIRKNLGGALWKVINHYIKTGKVLNPCKKYSIDWDGIIKVLSPIPKNRNKYHVDHIIQLWKFDLTNIEQIQIAFAPENHRWLLAKENQRRDRT